MPEKEYQRLTWARRRNTGAFSVSSGNTSLWLGKDHLLVIDTTGYSEEYKRFYYRDIQAITTQKSIRRIISSTILVVLLTIFTIVAMSVNNEPAWYGISIFILAPLIIMLVYNLVAGPTTRCFLRTAVQTEELPPLTRLWRVRKALNRLRPLIAEAQGTLTPEELSQRLGEFYSEKSAGDETPPVSPSPEVAPTMPPPPVLEP